MIRVTDSAQAYVANLAAERGCDPVVRVRIVGGGCQGLTWDVTLGAGAPREGDRRRTTGRVTSVVDPASARYLAGAALDFGPVTQNGLRQPSSGEPQASDLRVIRLAVKRTCECGESFPAS